MKIAYIAAGAGGMYCGSCIHDNTLAAALQRKGHDVALIPTYTPIRTDEESVSIDQIFFGGLNVYLQEKIGIFRHTPWKLDKIFNSPRLLNWISKFGSTTNAKDLGALTVSVLKGENGNQRKELLKLVSWLAEVYNPNVVHLTNSMFLGFAREIKKRLRVPILCSVQGEDLFLEQLIEPYKSQARQLLIQKARDVDGFVATSKYYADFMSDYLAVDPNRMHVVNLGISLQGHGDGELKFKGGTFVVGYLARICHEKGLHLLLDAFYRLWQELGPNKIQLKIAGYLDKKDQTYFNHLQEQISGWGLDSYVEYVGEVDRLGKIIFLNNVHVLSVPTIYKEPKGLFVLEALANGVPVVQPRHGSFPEIIEATGGGILVDPESSEDLARGIHTLMTDSGCRENLGRQGKEAVHRFFNDKVMAERTLAVYKDILTESVLQS